MITIEKTKFYLMIYILIILAAYYIYTIFLFHRAKLDKTTRRKFKHICKLEFRHPVDQEKLMITEFIEKYEETHNIDWEKVFN